MKTLIVILVLFSSSVFSQTMIPLNKYINQNKFEKNEMFYIFSRCSAVGYKMMDLSKNNQQLYDRGKKIHDNFYYFGSEITKENQENHKTIIKLAEIDFSKLLDGPT